MILTEQDIIGLTNRKHHSAQSRQLNAMGIAHTKRTDGSCVVAKDVVLEALGGSHVNYSDPKEPDWRGANA